MMDSNKPVIIAICGPAAAGKDTLLNALAPRLGATKIISDTTRPRRPMEQNHVDYNFIDKPQFQLNLFDDKYLEYSLFRGWYYGTAKDSVCGKVNIGVFNMDGVKSLFEHAYNYNVIPIYLQTSFFTRLKRYVQRDGRLSWECVRRFYTDYKQFYLADIWLDVLYPQHLVLKNFKIDQDLDKLAQYIVGDLLSDYYR